jgi:hypothetical protein
MSTKRKPRPECKSKCKSKRKPRRRRCSECRRWYTPEPSTRKTQKTCGKQCRLRRRAKQEKARREADLSNALKLERARKRRERERRATKEGTGPPMSRAGLSEQSLETIEEIIDKLGQSQPMSRAGLRRELRQLVLGEIARSDAKTGTGSTDVTGRARSGIS